MAALTLLSPTPCMPVLLVSLLVLVNPLVDVTYASLDPRIRYRPMICPTARGAIAREGFYERTASPEDQRCQSSRLAPSWPGGWRDTVRLAPGPAPGAVGSRSRHAQARRHPAHTWVGSPPLRFPSHGQQLHELPGELRLRPASAAQNRRGRAAGHLSHRTRSGRTLGRAGRYDGGLLSP